MVIASDGLNVHRSVSMFMMNCLAFEDFAVVKVFLSSLPQKLISPPPSCSILLLVVAASEA